MNSLSYEFNIDTGGTFTDCIAVDSTGKLHRCKVLSNSALRGNIAEWIGPAIVKTAGNWGLERDILEGFTFRLMKHNHPAARVLSFDPQQKILRLTKDLPETCMGIPLSFELISDEEAPVLGMRLITQTSVSEPLPASRIRLGSTKGTNALLERKGARMVFFVTRGFRDLLRIGTQQRPDIFARQVIKPDPLYEEVVEVDERIDATGNIRETMEMEPLGDTIASLVERGIDTAAVAFMNSYVNPQHEKAFRDFLLASGFNNVSVSSDLSSLIKFLPRAETTVVNSYLMPVISTYLKKVSGKAGRRSLYVMTSAGGLITSPEFHPKDSLLSGPAGGVVGAVAAGIRSGFNQLISFDMGGTSTDVARYGNEYEYRFDLEVGDAHIFSPSLAIETVAAGGGSICYFDGFKLCVGPESAGAFPGPACYGAGGPLTLTDINLLAGRLDTHQFEIPVFPEEAETRLRELIREIPGIPGQEPGKEELITGFLQIANEIMASAIKKISVARGYDPEVYTLVAFGGAGGLHACAMADLLNIHTILIPGDAGLLSAHGLMNAVVERFAEQQLLLPYEKASGSLPDLFFRLENEAIRMVEREGIGKDMIEIRLRAIYLRFKGQDAHIEVPFINILQVLQEFRKKYEEIYGHWAENRQIEVESIRVIASGSRPDPVIPGEEAVSWQPEPSHTISSYVSGTWRKTPVYILSGLCPGAEISGSALILGKYSTSVVEDGWILRIDRNRSAVMTRLPISDNDAKQVIDRPQLRETELELFTNRFTSIAEHMGSMLQRTSLSVNVKERLDFSCALLDDKGRLVTNAPHIPVHLGSLGLCVRTLCIRYRMDPGDTIVTNHPGYGGSHLPDITLVTPVYTAANQLVGYVVNRAHHAEIGGKRPASMPHDAASLAEEGVIIKPFYLVWNNIPDWDGMRTILTGGNYPSRAVEENLADLNAALAANRFGARALLHMVEEHGLEKVRAYMKALKELAAAKMALTLQKIPAGTYRAEEFLDDGTPLAVTVEITDRSCKIDFTGTGVLHPGNMNATPAIVSGVVIYVLRLLIDENIPLNDGILDPVEVIIPPGLLNPKFPEDPTKCPAIVGGNVEVSQRLTDTLLKAFGILACSQGTMNNVLFGNSRYSYYETLCGGCGAGRNFHGASAVHHHMTNTRITDPEIMEHRYPVVLNRFEIRKDSGGPGLFHGGNGVIREITFLEPASLSLLTQHRIERPYGMNGGEPGQPGEQYIVRSDGSKIGLKSVDGYEVDKSDRLIVLTPGGGGYGSVKQINR